MTSILRKVAILLAISMTAVLAWGQIARATVLVSVAQGAFAPVIQDQPSESNGQPPSGTENQPPNTSNPPGSQNQAMPPQLYGPKIYTGERISLDFQNADMHNIIRIIGEVSGKNIVISDAVDGKVTLKLQDVPWDQALDIVLSSRNLGVEESGNVLTIYDLATLTNIKAGRQRIAAERAAAFAQSPLVKKVFTPKYATLSAVATELTKLKSARGKIVSIGNDIYVEDDPGTLATMTQIFMRVDRVTRQILIEARIVEATSSFIQGLGISWGAKYDGGGVGGGTPGEGTGGIDVGASGILTSFGFLNKANSLLLNARLSADEISSDARTISAPRIMAANDQEVSIKQGTQIPYTTGATANTPSSTEFKDISMELKVTPHIEENGRIITLDIDLKNDTINLDAGTTAEPGIDTREAQTKLMVRDGETVVIGGIIVDQQLYAVNRVPVAHRIPLLGWMFQDKSISNKKTEMLIFITANIIPLNI